MEENNIPSYVLDIIYSQKTADFNTQIQLKYMLKPEQMHQLVILEGKILYKEISLSEFPVLIKAVLSLNSEKINALCVDICENLFLPAQPYLSGVKELITQLKLNQPQPNIVKPKNENVIDLKNLPKE